MKDDFLWMVAYWQAVGRWNILQAYALFTKAIRYFAGSDED